MKKGNLYLIPSDIGNDKLTDVLPQKVFDVILKTEVFIVENLRTARRFLRKAGFRQDFEKISFHLLDKHTKPEEYQSFLASCLQGKNTGLLSEAGTPCIADPGSAIVNLAHRQNIRVIPLVGPSSILLALMASGFNGQHFCFHGYLPIKKHERESKLRDLEKAAFSLNQTQIFIETPYRNMQMFASIIKTCNNKTQLCIATNISAEHEVIKKMPVSEWKKAKVDLHKKPTVYLIFV